MSKRSLPAARTATRRPSSGFELTPAAVEQWNPGLRAAASADEPTIDIFGVIGEDFFGGGNNTVKRISAALRSIGDKDVTVHINSPGGDFFEGLAIYNLLREHKGAVTAKVLGVAASAASIIAMAGDTIMVPRAGFLMIHNTLALVIGDRNDMREMAAFLEPFDEALASIYGARTGIAEKEIRGMLDRETWIGGQEAVDKGFADALLPSDEAVEDPKALQRQAPAAASHRLDALLARQGLPRAERRKLIKDIKSGMPGAAAPGTPGAAGSPALEEALGALRSIRLN